MNHKREVVDRYIDRELPGAIEKAVGEGGDRHGSEEGQHLPGDS